MKYETTYIPIRHLSEIIGFRKIIILKKNNKKYGIAVDVTIKELGVPNLVDSLIKSAEDKLNKYSRVPRKS